MNDIHPKTSNPEIAFRISEYREIVNKSRLKSWKLFQDSNHFLLILNSSYLFDEIPDQIRKRAAGVLLDIIQFLQS